MADRFDLVILGSGSTAFAAALRAAELGKSAAMTESRTLGGTCVNRGCLPSKNLIEAARIVWDAAKIELFDGHAAFVNEHTISVNGRTVEGDQLLIATGTRPSVPSIEG